MEDQRGVKTTSIHFKLLKALKALKIAMPELMEDVVEQPVQLEDEEKKVNEDGDLG